MHNPHLQAISVSIVIQFNWNIKCSFFFFMVFAWSSAFVMTCKPPLYMGPEYIKYLSDKTIDVSNGTFDYPDIEGLFCHFISLDV